MTQRKSTSTPQRIPRPRLCDMPGCGRLTYSRYCIDCNQRTGHRVKRVPEQGELFESTKFVPSNQEDGK